MNNQRLHATSTPISSRVSRHSDAVDLEGLDDLFKWASEMVADGQDGRVGRAREERIKRRVLETVRSFREQQSIIKNGDEVTYLQRRVIALLQKLQDETEENSVLKQTMVAQWITLQRLPELELEIERLKDTESERETLRKTQDELMNCLSRLKRERDLLDDLLEANEEENDRLVRLLRECRGELAEIKSRRWWHRLLPPLFRSRAELDLQR